LFRLLWYVQRIDALYQSLHSPLRARHISRVQTLLLDSIAADLETWQSYLDLNLEDTHSRQVTVTSSAQGLQRLSGEYDQLHASRQQAAQPWRVICTQALATCKLLDSRQMRAFSAIALTHRQIGGHTWTASVKCSVEGDTFAMGKQHPETNDLHTSLPSRTISI
jgi:hypothetical protein